MDKIMLTPSQKEQFVQTQIQASFEFLEIDIKNLDVKQSGDVWLWKVTRKSGQEIHGMLQDFDISASDMAHPGFMRFPIMAAVAIGLHPMAHAISTFLESYRSETIQEPGRNSMIEIMLRGILNSMIASDIPKGKAKELFMEEIHLSQNIEEKYAAEAQRKRH